MKFEFLNDLQFETDKLITKELLEKLANLDFKELFILVKRNSKVIDYTTDFSESFIEGAKRRKSSKRLAGIRLIILNNGGHDFNLGALILRYRLDNILLINKSANSYKLYLAGIEDGRLKDWSIKELSSIREVIKYNYQFEIEKMENKLAQVETHQVKAHHQDIGIIVSPFADELDEMTNLANTAGVIIKDRVIQKVNSINPTFYIGKGKVEEVRELIEIKKANMIIFADELSPVQHKNLENYLEVKVIDRTQLILDIFAQHANTREGKLQVELAQLEYLLPRLVGKGHVLSRLGAGIGTRGPGETKLEIDRRRIRDKIHTLKKELEKIKDNRKQQRKRRQDPVVAMVGYTNVGKSTLLNLLSEAEVVVEDKLFATLDSTLRKIELKDIGRQIIVSDTVGFIRRLPHQLIAAFKSTLEEVKQADILLNVVDASSLELEKEMEVVYDVLAQLDVLNKEIITVFNKIDLLSENKLKLLQQEYPESIIISAEKGVGIDKLLHNISEIIKQEMERVRLELDYEDANLVDQLHSNGKVLTEEYKQHKILLEALIPTPLANKLKEHRIKI